MWTSGVSSNRRSGAIMTPSRHLPAWLSRGWTRPTGVTADGRPGGIWMYSGFLREPTLLAFAYDLEQEIGGRPQPQYLGSLPPLPPDAGLCPVSTAATRAPRSAKSVAKNLGTGKRIRRH
jgi:hypothetical protein